MILFSCKKVNRELVEERYSVGIVSTEVISYTSTKAVIKVRFFVLDSRNNGKLILENISNNIFPEFDDLTLDSVNRITTPFKGNSSVAILVTDKYYKISYESFNYESYIRKILRSCAPTNEVLLSEVGLKSDVLSIINPGFTRNALELDLPLAEMMNNNDYYEPIDSLFLCKAIDSLINYMNNNGDCQNKNIIIFGGENSGYYEQFYDLNLLYNKAILNNVTFHDFGYGQLSPITGGVQSGSLNLLLMGSRLNDIMTGNFECFESVWTDSVIFNHFQSGGTYSNSFKIKLTTNYETIEVPIKFSYYIKP
jgi:hypothetical protein